MIAGKEKSDSGKFRLVSSAIILLAVVVADQLTKQWIINSFVLYERLEIISGFFNLTYLTNSGAAFGFLADANPAWRHTFFVVLVAVALIAMVVAFFRFYRDHALYGVSLSMIAGGAIGNLIDRLRHGSVVDFLDFYLGSSHYPAFNVADSAITIGVGLFLLGNILEEKNKKTRQTEN